jgi:hypothetical protein
VFLGRINKTGALQLQAAADFQAGQERAHHRAAAGPSAGIGWLPLHSFSRSQFT